MGSVSYNGSLSSYFPKTSEGCDTGIMLTLTPYNK